MDYISILQSAFTTVNIIYSTIGVIIGLTLGAIPGLSGDIGIAILLPFVYKLPTLPALGLLLGIYKANMFGGAISSISFGVPGTGAAVVTLIDGYAAKKKGYPRQALLTALFSSSTGDFFGILLLIFVAVPLSNFALKFGPKEYFSLYFFSILIISLLLQGTGGNYKGFVSTGIGLMLSIIGMDPMTGTTRLTFGIDRLRSGIPLIPLLIGTFAISELMIQYLKVWYLKRTNDNKTSKQYSGLYEEGIDRHKDKMTFKIYLSTLKATIIGCLVGTFIGALPGAGSSLATFVSYGAAKQLSSHPEQFGKGWLEGVAAPEAANNATVGSALIPLITLGIPGSATAALIGAAFMLLGLNPGPLMMKENMSTMITFFIIIFYAGFIMLGLGYLSIPVYCKIANLKGRFLYPLIFLFAVLGTYASNNSVTDIWLLLMTGLMGALLRKGGYPLGPLVLSYILGPGTEKSLRQALIISSGNWNALFDSSLAKFFYILCAFSMVFLYIVNKKQSLRIKNKKEGA